MIFSESSELNDFLDRDERLVWTGTPKKGIIFRKSDIFIIPFSIIWCGFAIFWIIMASKAGGLFGLLGIPFVLIGLLLAFGRFFIDKKQREKTFYGITDTRILIRSGIFSKKVDSIHIKTLTNLEFSEKADGSGTIKLGPNDPRDPFGLASSMSWWPGIKATPSLSDIENVREAYNIIIKFQKQ